MVKESIHWHLLHSPGSTKKKLLGDYPQVAKMNSEFNFADYYLIPENYNVPYFIASKKAKLTDFIFCINVYSGSSFIVNEKVKNLLDGFKLSPHLLMKTYALFGEEKLIYYVYYFLVKIWNMLIFKIHHSE